MKAISIHVPERDYGEIKSLSARVGRPVAELIRQAMAEYLERQRRTARSILDLPPHRSGDLLKTWSRTEVLDEMLKR
ncbi:ribbon-helix-helix domain-containing protein [Acidobacteria bacterium AH-259-L09]|nr:ribbon-helix-helix domain-containing protein [Acidobacteria bacterium AH-259-L09]